MTTLIVISSKSPNPCLYECINRLFTIQIKGDPSYKVCVVDSDSDDLSMYDMVSSRFPEVDIHFVKNKNYEYGAWKFAYATYPTYTRYMCIQDSVLLEKYIPLDRVNDKTAYTFHHHSGYNSHINIKREGFKILKQSRLNFWSIVVDTNFCLAQHSCFIVTNATIQDIFSALPVPPVNKDGSCIYERNFGLYFIFNGITTIDLYEFFYKYHGRRP